MRNPTSSARAPPHSSTAQFPVRRSRSTITDKHPHAEQQSTYMRNPRKGARAPPCSSTEQFAPLKSRDFWYYSCWHRRRRRSPFPFDETCNASAWTPHVTWILRKIGVREPVGSIDSLKHADKYAVILVSHIVAFYCALPAHCVPFSNGFGWHLDVHWPLPSSPQCWREQHRTIKWSKSYHNTHYP